MAQLIARAGLLCVAASAFAVGCGGHNAIGTARPVLALALDGNRVAWTDCHRIHVFANDRWSSSRLPGGLAQGYFTDGACRKGADFQEARLVFAGESVGWFFAAGGHGPRYAFALGVTSPGSRSTRVLRENPEYDYKADAGAEGSIASDGRELLWTWPQVALIGSPGHDCDIYGAGTGCKIRVSRARVHAWSQGRTRILHGIPPAGPIAAAGNWIAAGAVPAGTFSQSRSMAPRSVIVARRGGAVVARVPGSPGRLAISADVLAVVRTNGVALYRLPSGRFLRLVSVPPMGPGGPIGLTFSGNRLIVWAGDYVRVIEPDSGRTRILVRTSGPHGLGSDEAITAVAADGSRVAWAITDSNGHSLIYKREL